jgi:hypothetical protein
MMSGYFPVVWQVEFPTEWPVEPVMNGYSVRLILLLNDFEFRYPVSLRQIVSVRLIPTETQKIEYWIAKMKSVLFVLSCLILAINGAYQIKRYSEDMIMIPRETIIFKPMDGEIGTITRTSQPRHNYPFNYELPTDQRVGTATFRFSFAANSSCELRFGLDGCPPPYNRCNCDTFSVLLTNNTENVMKWEFEDTNLDYFLDVGMPQFCLHIKSNSYYLPTQISFKRQVTYPCYVQGCTQQ